MGPRLPCGRSPSARLSDDPRILYKLTPVALNCGQAKRARALIGKAVELAVIQ
ncbi:MAG TPA: hypothetical protein VEH27_14485 [Methylomirabilota bacterium]|nr:hypothetical protein [Methylomirabilota bacterium]